MVNREDLIFETNKNIYNFQQLKRITSFAKSIFNVKTILSNADKYPGILLIKIVKFNKSTKPRDFEEKSKKEMLLKS